MLWRRLSLDTKACISLFNSYRVAQELSVWPTIETGPEGPALHFLLNVCQERRWNHVLFLRAVRDSKEHKIPLLW